MMRGPSARPSALVLATLLGAIACSEPTGLSNDPNVEVFAGVGVTSTEDAIFVGGTPRIHLGSGPRMVIVSHQVEYDYGGLPEPVNDGLWDDQWYMDVGRSTFVEQRGDTLVRRYLDFGEVTLEGVPAMVLLNEEPHVIDDGNEIRLYENHLINRLVIYGYRRNRDGSEVSFVRQPFYDHMLTGAELSLVVGGSDDVEPTQATITARSVPRVVGLTSGAALDFETERQSVRIDRPLVLDLDREIDPDHALVRLFYVPLPGATVDPAVLDAARLVFALTGRTSRVVIPPSALAALAEMAPEEEADYILQINEYDYDEGLLELRRVGSDAVELGRAVHTRSFRIWVTMAREGS